MGAYYKAFLKKIEKNGWPKPEKAGHSYRYYQKNIVDAIALLNDEANNKSVPIDSYYDHISFIKDYRKVLSDFEDKYGKDFIDREINKIVSEEKASNPDYNAEDNRKKEQYYGNPSVVKAKDDFLKWFHKQSKDRQVMIKKSDKWPMIKQILETAEITDRDLHPYEKSKIVASLKK